MKTNNKATTLNIHLVPKWVIEIEKLIEEARCPHCVTRSEPSS